MCIAIVKPQGALIPDKYLKNSFENNDDGAGIAYSRDNRLHIIKGIFNKEQFIKCVRKAEKIAQGDMLIHCRIGTSGLRNKENCHPHIVNNSTVLIHNGILDIKIPKKSTESDTIVFIKKYLKNLPVDFIKNESIVKVIEFAIGKHNKFVFMNNEGRAVICNKDQGVVENGVWYSNESFLYGDEIFEQNYLTEDRYLFEHFKNLIEEFSFEDFCILGECPLINIDEYMFEEFSPKKYKNIDTYISLKNYSRHLYEMYMEKYNKMFCLPSSQAV